MRQKLVRSRISKPLPYQIITFDNADFNQYLTDPTVLQSQSLNKHRVLSHFHRLSLTASMASTVCLTSNQVGQQNSVIAISSHLQKDHNRQSALAWFSEKYCQPSHFRMLHLTKLLKGSNLTLMHEQSICMPFIHFQVKRYDEITIEYRNQQFQKITQNINGWQSHVIQQCLDTLSGILLFDWRVNHGRMSFQKDMVEYFPKTASAIEQYCFDLNKIFKQYPQLLNTPSEISQKQSKINQAQKQMLPIQIDFYRRLTKYYAKQMGILMQRLGPNATSQPQWPKRDIRTEKIK